MPIDFKTWQEYDLKARTEGVRDLLLLLDARERELDDKGRPLGNLTIIGLIGDARAHLEKAIKDFNTMDILMREVYAREHNDEYVS